MAIKRPVFIVTLALILGEFLAFLGAQVMIFIICVPVFLVQKIIMKKWNVFLMVIFLFCFIGFCITEKEINTAEKIYKMEEGYISICGTYKKCDETNYGYRYEMENIKLDEITLRKIIVYTSKQPEYKTGNIIQVSGRIKQFDVGTNYGNFDSRKYYRSLGIYLSIQESESKVLNYNYSKFREEMQRLRVIFKDVLRRICNDHNKGVFKICDSDKEGIFSAVILGDKSDLSESVESLYQINGIAHLLAISGLHISTIGVVIYKLLRKKFKFVMSGSVSMAVILGFVFMSGEGISSVRAAGMFIFYLFSQMIGRKYDMLSAMSFVTIISCLTNPFVLYNSAFQMSFGAILGILVVNPVISDFLGLTKINKISKKEIRHKKTLKKKIKIMARNGLVSCSKSVMLSISVNLILAPVFTNNFFQVSIYSILLNVIVIPFMSVVLGSGIIAVGIEMVFARSIVNKFININCGLCIGKILVLPGCIILELYEILGNIFSKIPGNIYVAGKPTGVQIVVYYMVLALVLYVLRCLRKLTTATKAFATSNKMKQVYINEEKVTKGRSIGLITKGMQRFNFIKASGKVIITVAFAIGLLFIVSYHEHNKLTVMFNDVGQGDSIVLKKGDFVMMVDGGSIDVSELKEYRLEPLLKARGITEIDYAVVTHADTDHISGLLEMLEEKAVDKVRVNSLVLPSVIIKDKVYEKLIMAASKANVKVLHIDEGDEIKRNGIVVRCLHPAGEYKTQEKNEHSTVLDVKYGDFSMLLTGDISSEVEKIVTERIKTYDEKCKNKNNNGYTILKVAHHGSKYSTTEEFLKIVHPRVSVISCGENNSYGHPHNEVISRLENSKSKVLRTDKMGQIVVKTDGDAMEIVSMR